MSLYSILIAFIVTKKLVCLNGYIYPITRYNPHIKGFYLQNKQSNKEESNNYPDYIIPDWVWKTAFKYNRPTKLSKKKKEEYIRQFEKKPKK